MVSKDKSDDLRQAAVVAKFEVKKFLNGKRILILGVLMLLIIALIIYIQFNNSGYKDGKELAKLFVGNVSLFPLIAATLFGAVTLVAEFEERTALVLFTKPVRKWAIFLGKEIAVCGISLGFIIMYYVIAAIDCVAYCGSIPSELWLSMAYCLLYTFAVTGVAMLFSSFSKKSSTASVLTFFTILLLISLVTLMIALATNNNDIWYMLDQASNSIFGCFDGNPNGPRTAAVMIIWGILSSLSAYVVFWRREF
jgi:ABC-2 type transport system permease protein